MRTMEEQRATYDASMVVYRAKMDEWEQNGRTTPPPPRPVPPHIVGRDDTRAEREKR